MVWFYARRLESCSLSNRRGPFARSLERLFERARARIYVSVFTDGRQTNHSLSLFLRSNRTRYTRISIGVYTETRPVHSWGLFYSGKSMLFYNQRAMRLAISPSTRLNRINAIERELTGIRRIDRKKIFVRLENRTKKKRKKRKKYIE